MFNFNKILVSPDWLAFCFIIIVVFMLVLAFWGSNTTQKIPTYLENERTNFPEKFEEDQ